MGKINPIVGVYIPIIRIPIKGGIFPIPNIATFDHGTHDFWRIFRVNFHLFICIQVTLVDAGYSEKGSWGETRIARVSYVDPVLLRLARRSYELYAELAEISGEKLM